MNRNPLGGTSSFPFTDGAGLGLAGSAAHGIIDANWSPLRALLADVESSMTLTWDELDGWWSVPPGASAPRLSNWRQWPVPGYDRA